MTDQGLVWRADIPIILGICKTRVTYLISRGAFPAPALIIGRRHYYDANQVVECYKRAKDGRKKNGGVLDKLRLELPCCHADTNDNKALRMSNEFCSAIYRARANAR